MRSLRFSQTVTSLIMGLPISCHLPWSETGRRSLAVNRPWLSHFRHTGAAVLCPTLTGGRPVMFPCIWHDVSASGSLIYEHVCLEVIQRSDLEKRSRGSTEALRWVSWTAWPAPHGPGYQSPWLLLQSLPMAMLGTKLASVTVLQLLLETSTVEDRRPWWVLFILIIALLRYNWYAIQFTYLKCAVQCFL
jgi:hypothetical protein